MPHCCFLAVSYAYYRRISYSANTTCFKLEYKYFLMITTISTCLHTYRSNPLQGIYLSIIFFAYHNRGCAYRAARRSSSWVNIWKALTEESQLLNCQVFLTPVRSQSVSSSQDGQQLHSPKKPWRRLAPHPADPTTLLSSALQASPDSLWWRKCPAAPPRVPRGVWNGPSRAGAKANWRKSSSKPPQISVSEDNNLCTF